jgi:hypothetical protein
VGQTRGNVTSLPFGQEVAGGTLDRHEKDSHAVCA